MKKLKEKILLEKKVLDLCIDQYDYFDDEEIFKKQKAYARSIGNFLISFSYLEYSLDQMIARAINSGGDELGYRLVKYLNFKNKFNFINDHFSSLINYIDEKAKINERKKLKLIINKLTEISEFRNKVAHANWTTLNKNGFVRFKIDENRDEGRMVFQLVKITPQIINKFIRQSYAVANRIDTFNEEIYQRF